MIDMSAHLDESPVQSIEDRRDVIDQVITTFFGLIEEEGDLGSVGAYLLYDVNIPDKYVYAIADKLQLDVRVVFKSLLSARTTLQKAQNEAERLEELNAKARNLYSGRILEHFNDIPDISQLEDADLYHGITITIPSIGKLRVRAVSPDDEVSVAKVRALTAMGYENYNASKYKSVLAESASPYKRVPILLEIRGDSGIMIPVATFTAELGVTETMTLTADDNEITVERDKNIDQSSSVPHSWGADVGNCVEVGSLTFANLGGKVGIEKDKFAIQLTLLTMICAEIARRNSATKLIFMLKPQLAGLIEILTEASLTESYKNYNLNPFGGPYKRFNGIKYNIPYFLRFNSYFLPEAEFQICGRTYTATEMSRIYDSYLDAHMERSPDDVVHLPDGQAIRFEDFNRELGEQIYRWTAVNKTKKGPLIYEVNPQEYLTLLIKKSTEQIDMFRIREFEDVLSGKTGIKSLNSTALGLNDHYMKSFDNEIRKLIGRPQESGVDQLQTMDIFSSASLVDVNREEYSFSYDIVLSGQKEKTRLVITYFPWNNADLQYQIAYNPVKRTLTVTNNARLHEAMRVTRHWLNFGAQQTIDDTAKLGFSFKKPKSDTGDVSVEDITLKEDMARRGALASVLVDPNMDMIRSTKVAVLGLGTVGGSIAKGLAMLGVQTIHTFEDPDESYSLSNSNRIGGQSQLGNKKWSQTMGDLADINPFASIIGQGYKYFGRVDADSFERYLIEEQQHDRLPDVVFLAIDDLQMQIRVHQIAYQFGVKLVLITDIGAGAQLKFYNYPIDDLFHGKVTPSDYSNPKLFIPKMLGKLELLTKFDAQTVLSFSKSAELGILPQSHAASSAATQLAQLVILNRVQNFGRFNMRRTTYVDPTNDIKRGFQAAVRDLLKIDVGGIKKKIKGLRES